MASISTRRLVDVSAEAGMHLIVDSTVLSIVGEGEWDKAKHGGRGLRGWKKLHLGADRSSVIVAKALTEGSVDDATYWYHADRGGRKVDLGSVTADAAYDTVGFYAAAGARGTAVVVPKTSSANVARHAQRSSVAEIARSWRSRRWGGDARRRRRVTIGRPAWRTPSAGTSRSSETGFEPGVLQGREPRPSSTCHLAQSDDCTWQASVVRHGSVTELWVGIVAG